MRAVALISVLFALPASAQVVRAPYLQQSTPDSVTVVWRTLIPATGRVFYGSAPNALDSTVDGEPFAFQHEVRVTGLTPDTLYYYAVGTEDGVEAGQTAQHFFRTAPVPGSNKPARMWIVGDSGTGGLDQALVRDAMLDYTQKTGRPDLFLHMGDMAYGDGEDLEFQFNFFAVYEKILQNTVCWPTMGNHEGKSSDSGSQSGPYYDAYVLPKQGEAGGVPSGTEAYYSFDHGNVHFVVLDSHDSPRQPGGAMLQWLEEDLAQADADWVIAYWHHPPYTKGSHDSDVETQLIQMRENAVPILEAAGVDLVLAGHSHVYERSYLIDGATDTPTTAAGHIVDGGDGRPLGDGPYTKPDGGNAGAVYIVAGHGGASIKAASLHPVMYVAETAHGSCILDVHDKSLTVRNLRKDGTISDHFSMIREDGILVTSPNGGETWGGGQSQDIRWASGEGVGTVAIELSTDGGESWQALAGPIANTGVWTWDVPAMSTDEALVRVRQTNNASLDQSDTEFRLIPAGPQEIIPWGAVWKVHDANNALQGWTAIDYDDSGWGEGPAPLGYGDGDEATLLYDADPNVPSVYFRKHFMLDEESAQASLEVIYDDAIAVWFNGQKVLERNMGFGTSHYVWASDQSNDNAYAADQWDYDTINPFVVGENVVAVMVKQHSEGSSDISFDLRLQVAPVPPEEPDPPADTGGTDDGGPTTADGGTEDTTASGEAGTTTTGDDGGTDADTTGSDTTGTDTMEADTMGADTTGASGDGRGTGASTTAGAGADTTTTDGASAGIPPQTDGSSGGDDEGRRADTGCATGGSSPFEASAGLLLGGIAWLVIRRRRGLWRA